MKSIFKLTSLPKAVIPICGRAKIRYTIAVLNRQTVTRKSLWACWAEIFPVFWRDFFIALIINMPRVIATIQTPIISIAIPTRRKKHHTCLNIYYKFQQNESKHYYISFLNEVWSCPVQICVIYQGSILYSHSLLWNVMPRYPGLIFFDKLASQIHSKIIRKCKYSNFVSPIGFI